MSQSAPPTAPPPADVDLLTVEEVARAVRRTPRTVYQWVADRQFPSPIKIGRTTRWRRSTLLRFYAELEAGGAQ